MTAHQISLLIDQKRYTITFEEPFGDEMEEAVRATFDLDQEHSTRELLQAYLSKTLDCLVLEKKIKDLLEKFPD